jgi:MFS family permease
VDKYKIPLTKSIFYVGKFFGAYMFGWISDRYGRRVVFFVTAFVQFISSFATTFSPNYYMYMILRLPIGICSGGKSNSQFINITAIDKSTIIKYLPYEINLYYQFSVVTTITFITIVLIFISSSS